jgi:hypothetical protein
MNSHITSAALPLPCLIGTPATCPVQEPWGCLFVPRTDCCYSPNPHTSSARPHHSHKVSRRGQLPRATSSHPSVYSPSNVRADLRVGSYSSMGKGLGATGGVVAREDHSQHNDGQPQPQPQQDQADYVALGHGLVVQRDRGGTWGDTPADGQRDKQTSR